jgi:hypothetical protein
MVQVKMVLALKIGVSCKGSRGWPVIMVGLNSKTVDVLGNTRGQFR